MGREKEEGGKRRQLGPSYDEEAYWNDKFARNVDSFEWLGNGGVLLEAFGEYVAGERSKEDRTANRHDEATTPPTVLHLGAGTSLLSLQVARDFPIHGPNQSRDLSSIINVDFSQLALDYGKEHASRAGLDGMRYVRADLRDWTQLVELRSQSTSFFDSSSGLFDFIFDKSTSDALSTNEDIPCNAAHSGASCPLLTHTLTDNSAPTTPLDPLDLVAVHLAALSKPGCRWAVLSYSSSRFDFLLPQPPSTGETSCISKRYWSMRKRESIQAPSGSDDPSAPPVFHWFYLLERNHCSSPDVEKGAN